MKYLYVFLAALIVSCNQMPDNKITDFVPENFSQHDLVFDKPVERWDEAIPLGNGMMGILVWGDGHPLKLSLDRADLWDTRPVEEWESPDYNYETMRKWVKQGRIEDLHGLYELPYRNNPGSTKIPAGRIEIYFPDGVSLKSTRLSLKDATAVVEMSDGTKLKIFQHATDPVGVLSISGCEILPVIELIAPKFGGFRNYGKKFNSLNTGELARLGYKYPEEIQNENGQSFQQQGWGDFKFAVATSWERKENKNWEFAWSIASSNETENPLALAQKRSGEALHKGCNNLEKSHLTWWKNYWNQARIFVPNPIIERQWYLETYKFGSVARRGAPPITLQAVWTADEGKIPPWKGDYHHDLNTELSYWLCYSGNHLEEGLSFLDWLWETLPEVHKYTQKFFSKPGICVPMTADIEGKQMGGWHQYTHSATIAAWLAHHFYLHWRYSMDRDFLKERAYPYLKQAAIFLEAITEKDKNGKRFLPLSSSPEINDKRLEAWLPPTSNYDLALMRWLFSSSAELAAELNIKEDQQHWLSVLKEFLDFAFSPEDGRLLVAPNLPLKESHRHFSHLMAIHPLGLFQWEDGESSQKVIRGALDELDRLGTDYWTGYSFSWLANMAARCKDGTRAEKALEIFSRAFCSKNSFYLNGDQTKSGYSRFTYRPFTLEGNMAAAAGVQEMLLQSYGGIIRIFPAIPGTWKDVGFYQLRAEGAFLVSAKRKSGNLKKVEIISEKGGKLEIENPFADQDFVVRTQKAIPVKSEGRLLKFNCQSGGKVIFYKN